MGSNNDSKVQEDVLTCREFISLQCRDYFTGYIPNKKSLCSRLIQMQILLPHVYECSTYNMVKRKSSTIISIVISHKVLCAQRTTKKCQKEAIYEEVYAFKICVFKCEIYLRASKANVVHIK